MNECTKKQLSLPLGGLALHVVMDSMNIVNSDLDMKELNKAAVTK
jgi:hypothetical protein